MAADLKQARKKEPAERFSYEGAEVCLAVIELQIKMNKSNRDRCQKLKDWKASEYFTGVIAGLEVAEVIIENGRRRSLEENTENHTTNQTKA